MEQNQPKDCTCYKCVGACELVPGWFAPGEAEMAAEFLGVPFEKFKESLVIDHCSNENVNDAPYIYSPKKQHEQGNAEIRTAAMQRKRGPCVFLVEGRCSIHAVKPYECKKVLACDYDNHGSGVRDDLERIWRAAGAPLGMRPEVEVENWHSWLEED